MISAIEAIATNRRLKAAKIHAALVRNGITREHVCKFTAHSWDYAAMLAGYRHKPDSEEPLLSPETKGYVVDLFELQENPRSHVQKLRA